MTANAVQIIIPTPPLLPDTQQDGASHYMGWADNAERIAAQALAVSAALKLAGENLPTEQAAAEREAAAMSQHFQEMKQVAISLNDLVQSLIDVVGNYASDGKQVPIQKFIGLFRQSLDVSVAKILSVSEKSLRVVYRMQDAMKYLQDIEIYSRDIQTITKQANFLAVNALIEAGRAGDEGGGFTVVAHEMKTLSSKISDLSENMRTRTGMIMQGFTRSYDTLKELATTDMNENIAANEKLEELMYDFAVQADRAIVTMKESAESSRQLMQKVDRLQADPASVKKHLQVSGDLAAMVGECLHLLQSIRTHAEEQCAGLPKAGDDPVLREAVYRITNAMNIEDLRKRYLATLREMSA